MGHCENATPPLCASMQYLGILLHLADALKYFTFTLLIRIINTKKISSILPKIYMHLNIVLLSNPVKEILAPP